MMTPYNFGHLEVHIRAQALGKYNKIIRQMGGNSGNGASTDYRFLKIPVSKAGIEFMTNVVFPQFHPTCVIARYVGPSGRSAEMKLNHFHPSKYKTELNFRFELWLHEAAKIGKQAEEEYAERRRVEEEKQTAEKLAAFSRLVETLDHVQKRGGLHDHLRKVANDLTVYEMTALTSILHKRAV